MVGAGDLRPSVERAAGARAMTFHRRPTRVVLLLLGVSGATSALACALASHLLWNRTASLPVGLYWVGRPTCFERGDLVVFPVPPAVRALVHARGYLPDGYVLLKPVVAVAGDRVCAEGGVAFVGGAPFGPVLATDSEGRALPHDALCGDVPPGRLYVASHHPQSFDSRTFGPIDAATVRGKATPLWTY
jgi:conjugative transfer signal peptidase TraF